MQSNALTKSLHVGVVVPTPPLNTTMGKNRKWAPTTKAKGHPKYNATCIKIEERGKTSWEKPPLKI